VTPLAVIDLRSDGWTPLRAKLRGEEGIGLVELMIALLVLNIGIFATLGAFTSGALALRRASHVSTATAISDRYMECFRDVSPTATSDSYNNIKWPLDPTSLPAGSLCATPLTPGQQYATVPGPDSRQYSVTANVSYEPPNQGPTSLKLVTLTVTDVRENKLLVTSSSTFSQCAQDQTNAACGGS
jgi:Tfp pilus assembly protein PilV